MLSGGGKPSDAMTAWVTVHMSTRIASVASSLLFMSLSLKLMKLVKLRGLIGINNRPH